MSGTKDPLDRVAQLVTIFVGVTSIISTIALLNMQAKRQDSLSSSCAPCSLSGPPRRKSIRR
jgi:hypothetical protein